MKLLSSSVSGLATAAMLLAPLPALAQSAAADAAPTVEAAVDAVVETARDGADNVAGAAVEAAEALVADAAAEATAEATAAAMAAADAAQAASAGNIAACGSNTLWVGGEAAASQLDGRAQPWMLDLRGSGPQGRMFRLSEPTEIRLETFTKNSGDPVLNLFDAAGDTVAQSDDASGSYNSQIVTGLEPGDYCIVAEDLRNRMDLTLLVGLETHDSLLSASDLACGPQTQAQDLRDKDLSAYLAQGPYSYHSDAKGNGYVKFTTEGSAPLSLRAVAGDGIDPMMTLFDENGQEIATNNDADGVNARLDFLNGLPQGSYCLGVRAAAPAEGKITLSAQVLDIAAYKRSAYERGELAPVDGSYPLQPLVFNRPHGEIILQGNTVTWLDFALEERSIISLRTLGTPSGADTMLSLFDESGEMLVQVDDTDSSRNAAIAPMVLQKGRYLVALSDRASSSQFGAPLRPVVLVGERFIRAPQN